ncbi:MAG: hypothetical protein ACSHX7_03940 [Luteolibacter sp.]
MRLDLPQNLQNTADILRNSMTLGSLEIAPIMPQGLFEDLAARFETSPAVATPSTQISFFNKVQSFFATPAFGAAAAALVILTVALPAVLKTSTDSDTTEFRGSSENVVATSPISIVLIDAPVNLSSSLGNSGDFEKDSILTTDTASGAKVLVNFGNSTISSVTADGETVHITNLPADQTALNAAIATAISRL